jgi:cytoskeletal protein CcmA (bactofilin family)
MNDLKLSGAQVIGGGEYADIHCSGSIKIEGDIKCESFFNSGSCRALGDVACAHEFRTSGSVSSGALSAEKLVSSGTLNVDSFSGGSLEASGSFHCRGALQGDSIVVTGSLQSAGIEAESVRLCGSFRVSGQIDAEHVAIKLSSMIRGQAESIVGSQIQIGCTFERKIFGFLGACVHVQTIEGDDLDLDFVDADVVRGKNVRIGKRCSIGRLEYSETVQIEPGAQIAESVQV